MEHGLKQMPIGIDNFKELIVKNGYYVDKTLLIKEVIENISKVILFTRPRRFGKTLNFSMLKYFLERPECRRNDHEDEDYLYLFEGLAITRDKEFVSKHFGQYPVINFSFKKIKANTWQDAAYLFMEEISREYRRHGYLLETNSIRTTGERERFIKILNREGRVIEYTAAIRDLSEYLYEFCRKQAVVFIDEYDTPLHYAKVGGYYEEMLNIIRAFMVDGLKGNDYMEKGIVTGIMKISQESIFSAFNNPEIATLTNRYCADKFGFTENEVEDMLDYYGLSYGEVVREWYNGYLFGGETVIYNPWSIINFMKTEEHVPACFWINTGDTELIKKCLRLDQVKSKEYMERLYQGETVTMEIEQNIVYEDVLHDVDKALSYLLHAGYLKATRIEGEGERYHFSIPNREVAQIYKNILKNWFTVDQKTNQMLHDLIDSLRRENLVDFEIHLQDILMSTISYYDTPGGRSRRSEAGLEKEKYENFYHGLMLGLMIHLSDEYYVESNKEYGLGRPDIVIVPKDKTKKAYILEFKNEYSFTKKTAEEGAREALAQIDTRRYEDGVKGAGVRDVIKIGLGFKGKELKLAY